MAIPNFYGKKLPLDERIFLRLTRDLRPDAQILLVKYTTGNWSRSSAILLHLYSAG